MEAVATTSPSQSEGSQQSATSSAMIQPQASTCSISQGSESEDVVFHYFPKLPTEIQQMIWRASVEFLAGIMATVKKKEYLTAMVSSDSPAYLEPVVLSFFGAHWRFDYISKRQALYSRPMPMPSEAFVNYAARQYILSLFSRLPGVRLAKTDTFFATVSDPEHDGILLESDAEKWCSAPPKTSDSEDIPCWNPERVEAKHGSLFVICYNFLHDCIEQNGLHTRTALLAISGASILKIIIQNDLFFDSLETRDYVIKTIPGHVYRLDEASMQWKPKAWFDKLEESKPEELKDVDKHELSILLPYAAKHCGPKLREIHLVRPTEIKKTTSYVIPFLKGRA